MLKRTLSAIILAAAFLASPAIVPSYAQEPSQGQQQDDKMKDDKMAGDKMQGKKGKHKKSKKNKDGDKMEGDKKP